MPYLLNILYFLILLFLSPWLLYKSLTVGKYRRGLWRKLTGSAFLRPGNRPCVWFHGVSVGEIHLLRQVIAAFRLRHPDWDCAVSTTTDTGFDEATKRFADLPVFFWPLDFSWAVKRALWRVRPSLIVLAEGELWPNFILAAKRAGVPLAVLNARMSPRSTRRYQILQFLTRPLFQRLDLVLAQTREYAENYQSLGVPAEKVHVTGSVKYDGVTMNRDNPRTAELRRLFDVRSDDLVWIAGSTQAPEEKIALAIYRRAREVHPNLRLFLVPRQKDRFDEVARLLEQRELPYVRRSALNPQSAIRDPRSAVVLVDTIGELGALWGLADVAFVGGSLDGQRGGQNMIEPAAYGAAVLFGPHVWNFKETVERLLEHKAAVQVANALELERAVLQLLSNRRLRVQLGTVAQQFVRSQEGATRRSLDLLKLQLGESGEYQRRAG